MTIDKNHIITCIQKHIPDAIIEMESEDNVHFYARIGSSAFSGLSTLAQHRLVYDAIGEAVGREIHALSMKTYVIDEDEGGKLCQ